MFWKCRQLKLRNSYNLNNYNLHRFKNIVSVFAGENFADLLIIYDLTFLFFLSDKYL